MNPNIQNGAMQAGRVAQPVLGNQNNPRRNIASRMPKGNSQTGNIFDSISNFFNPSAPTINQSAPPLATSSPTQSSLPTQPLDAQSINTVGANEYGDTKDLNKYGMIVNHDYENSLNRTSSPATFVGYDLDATNKAGNIADYHKKALPQGIKSALDVEEAYSRPDHPSYVVKDTSLYGDEAGLGRNDHWAIGSNQLEDEFSHGQSSDWGKGRMTVTLPVTSKMIEDASMVDKNGDLLYPQYFNFLKYAQRATQSSFPKTISSQGSQALTPAEMSGYYPNGNNIDLNNSMYQKAQKEAYDRLGQPYPYIGKP